MRKTLITYFLFIAAMSAFIALRIYAGNHPDRKPSAALQPKEEAVSAAAEEPVETETEETGENAGPDIPVEASVPKSQKDDREYLWHGDAEPKSEYEGPLPRIVCWGDSLTVSLDGSSAFPDILRELSGCEVVNYGVESENTAMIAMREGGLRVNVKATVIPAEPDLIPVFLRTENDGHVFFLDHGDGGVNPCSINGIEGELQKLNGSYYFKRSQKGERIAVEDDTRFKTFAMSDQRENDVLVIFAGTNDLPDRKSVQNIINLERRMIESAACSKYIIVGLTYAGGIPDIDEVNEAMARAFGDHFVDIRKYMLNYGIQDIGLVMTGQDAADIQKGEIPSQLRSDHIHGNKHYHRLLGEQIYRRMVYLGYLNREEP